MTTMKSDEMQSVISEAKQNRFATIPKLTDEGKSKGLTLLPSCRYQSAREISMTLSMKNEDT